MKQDLYPTSISSAVKYTPNNGYTISDTLVPGRGYWIDFDVDQFVELSGTIMNAETLDVDSGWNLIGCLSDSIPTSSIGSIPPGMITSQFIGYDGTYSTKNTLVSGQGYWVKTSHNGQLILSSNGLDHPIQEHPTREICPRIFIWKKTSPIPSIHLRP